MSSSVTFFILHFFILNATSPTVHRTLNRIISRTFLAQFGLVKDVLPINGGGEIQPREGQALGMVAAVIREARQ